MEILITLPLLFIAGVFHISLGRGQGDPARAIIQTLVIFALFVYTSTEVLSATSSLISPNGIALWSVAVATLAVACVIRRGAIRKKLGCDKSFVMPSHTGRSDKLLGGVVLAILVGTLVSAILGAPNTADALIYHIPRVLHWIQNGNVGFYTTHLERQLVHPPLAEYCFLQLQLLTNSDRFFNLVQWTSFVGCLALSVAFAKAVGANGKGVRLSLLFTATLPMAVMQASSPKNDLLFAFFMVAFAYFLLTMIQGVFWSSAFMAGSSLGLALATKGSAFLFAPAIGLPIGIYWICTSPTGSLFRQRFIRLVAVALFGVLLATPHMVRNYHHYSTVLSSGSDNLTNQDYSPFAIFVNLVRMTGSHLATPVPSVSRKVEAVLEHVVGEELNNPKNIFNSEANRRFRMDAAPTETKMSNPIHLLVFAFASFILIARRKEASIPRILAFCAIAVFVVFAVFIQWCDWSARLHLTAFLIASPIAGYILSRGTSAAKFRIPEIVVCATASVMAIFCSIFNVYRPVLPFRNISILTTPIYDQFFMYDNSTRVVQYGRKALMESIVTTSLQRARSSDGAKKIGLICSGSSTEYLWWKVADELHEHPVVFQQVYVENTSKSFGPEEPVPDIIITEPGATRNQLAMLEADGFRKISGEKDYSVYVQR